MRGFASVAALAPTRPDIRTGLALGQAARYLASMRWRSPLAGLAIIAGLAVYVIAAVTLADFVPDHVLAESLYFLVAGVVWIWPAVSVIGWARRDPGSEET
ncbi:MAG: DUF2842 domain-containing protein [Thalassobaculum sp.]|jgi:uncharacterized membrane protein